MIVGMIGDTHFPFCRKEYLDHCKKVFKKYKVDRIIHIGDVVDNHATSFHTSDPDGFGALDELDEAIKDVAEWYKEFPEVDVILGNHCRIITRKASLSGISDRWVKEYNEVLGTPNWKWHIDLEIDGVLYHHGEGATARTMMKNYGQSVVGGHRHTECYLEYFFNPNGANFGMQIGCGIDRNSYAMAYARAYKHQALACGIVIDGKIAHLEPMIK